MSRRIWWLDGVAGLAAGIAMGVPVAALYLTVKLGLSLRNFDPFLLFSIPLGEALQGGDARVAYLIPLALGGVLCLVAIGLTLQRKWNDYGDAHWQTKNEVGANGNFGKPGHEFIVAKWSKPKRRVADYITTSEDQPHVMMVAPTGAGKGVGFVIPNCLVFSGSLVVLDVKGENYAKTARYRASRHNAKVFRFSPFDPDGRTHCYNPMAEIAALEDHDDRFTELNRLANIFLRMEGGSGKGWETNARRLFVGLALYAIEQGEPTFAHVLALIQAETDKAEAFKGFAEKSGSTAVRGILNEFAGMNAKILDSYCSVLTESGLQLWQDPKVARATGSSDFSFADIRRENTAVYIVVPPDDIETLAPLIRMIFGQLVALLQRSEPTKEEKHPVAIIVDEFQQLGRMPIIERSINTLRSYGGRLCLIAQSLPGLDTVYGEDGRLNLEAGSGMKLYITPQERKTAKELADAVGTMTRTVTSYSLAAPTTRAVLRGRSVSEREEAKPLLSKDEAIRLDRELVILLPRGQYPIKAQRIRYYDDAFLSRHYESQETMDFLQKPEVVRRRRAARVPVKVGLDAIKGDMREGLSSPDIPEILEAAKAVEEDRVEEVNPVLKSDVQLARENVAAIHTEMNAVNIRSLT